MRIAMLSSPDLVNSNYRAYQPMSILTRRGHEVIHNRSERPITPQELHEVDAVFLHRIATPEIQRVVRGAREAGVGIVWDNDDNVAAVPRSNPLYAKYGGFKSREMLAGVTQMVRLADVSTTPSAVLAEQYRELGGADVRIVENYVPTEWAPVRPQKHQGTVVVWLAALEHQVDHQELGMRETLARLLDAHPDLRVVSLGLGLGLEGERYENHKLIPFMDLARVLSRADIGIAPLVDIPWNRARSNVKLKEYASAGIPWLASPVGPYAGMGEQQGGRLVEDGDWYAAIERLIVNGRERRKLGKRAAKWVKGESIDRNAHHWERALRDAAERGRARRGAAVAV